MNAEGKKLNKNNFIITVLFNIAAFSMLNFSSAHTQASDGIRFDDVTATSGISVSMTSGGTPSSQILEVKGGGLALIDFDNDGDIDIFMPNGATLADTEHGPGSRLFENLGGLKFRDVSSSMGDRPTRWSFGCAVGDIDGDGRDDIYICCFGADILLRNLGGGQFEDATAKCGLGDKGWSTSAGFSDLDGDGDLDLFVVRYVDFDPSAPPAPAQFKGIPVLAGPRGFSAQKDILYLNDGHGKFRDVTQAAGIGTALAGFGLNLAILDFDSDGRLDIFVANDSEPNSLFMNRTLAGGALQFEERGMASGVATNLDGAGQATMGIAIGDVDGNGFADVFTTNFSSDTNTLHLNLDGRFFDDRTAQYGLGAPSRPLLGWATAFADLDHDGQEDLVILNGHVYPQATKITMDSDYEEPPLVMKRSGSRFAVVNDPGPGLQGAHRDRTALFADFDGDGDIDIVVGELNGPVRVLRNLHDQKDDWVKVRLSGATPGASHGVGASVELFAGGTRIAKRWVWAGGPFQSTAATELHFAAPANLGELSVAVLWPQLNSNFGSAPVASERKAVSRGRVAEFRDPRSSEKR